MTKKSKSYDPLKGIAMRFSSFFVSRVAFGAPTTGQTINRETIPSRSRFAIWDCVWQLNKSSFFPPLLGVNSELLPRNVYKNQIATMESIRFSPYCSNVFASILCICVRVCMFVLASEKLRTHNKTIHKYMSNKIHLVWSPWKKLFDDKPNAHILNKWFFFRFIIFDCRSGSMFCIYLCVCFILSGTKTASINYC